MWFESLQLSTPLVLDNPIKTPHPILYLDSNHSVLNQNSLSWPTVNTWPPMTQPIPRHCLTHWVNASHRRYRKQHQIDCHCGTYVGCPPKDVEYLIANSQQDSICQYAASWFEWIQTHRNRWALQMQHSVACPAIAIHLNLNKEAHPLVENHFKKTNVDPYRLNERKEIDLPSSILLRSCTSQRSKRLTRHSSVAASLPAEFIRLLKLTSSGKKLKEPRLI